MISHFLDMELIINDMERKIGEIFECSGVKLRVEPGICLCNGCYFKCDSLNWCTQYKSVRGECQKSSRSDIGIIFKKVGDMEERTIKLTLEKAKEFYKKGGEFRDLALSAFTEKELQEATLPNTWDEFCSKYGVQNEYYINSDSIIKRAPLNNFRLTYRDRNLLPDKQAAEQHLALMQLHQLRDCYRQGWEPNWTDKSTKYYVYISCHGIGIIASTIEEKHFLAFQAKELAEAFLNNFRDLIIKAGDLV